MKQTKITVKVYEPLLKSFNKKLETCFIKRDAFLNHMIKSEVRNLASDTKGLQLSNPARRYISGELKRLGTKTINVVVDKDTAETLNLTIKETNMVRDAFINRLILFLNASETFLERRGIATQINDRSLSNTESISTSPLQGIMSIVHDPFFYLRTDLEENHEERLYTFELPKELVAMSCYINDANVPGTDNYIKQQGEEVEFSKIMDQILAPLE